MDRDRLRSVKNRISGGRDIRWRRFLLTGGLMLTIALAGCATRHERAARRDQGGAPGFGHLSAVASATPGPAGATIAMRPGADDALFGNDPQYVAARSSAERAIRNFGFREGVPGQWTLAISITHTSYPGKPPESLEPPLRNPHVGQGSPPTPVPVPQVNVAVDRPVEYQPARTALSLSLFQPGRSPIWTATLEATGGVDDPIKLVAQMTDAAMESFGTTSEKDYVLSCNGRPRAPGNLCLY